MPDPRAIESVLCGIFGFRLEAEIVRQDGGVNTSIRPADLVQGRGFCVRVDLSPLRAAARLEFETFSVPLIASMGERAFRDPERLVRSIESVRSRCPNVMLKVNNESIEHLDFETIPDKWRELELEIRSDPMVVDMSDARVTTDTITEWAGLLMGVVVAMLPLEHVKDTVYQGEFSDDVKGVPEGAVKIVRVNRYERSPHNRMECIRTRGLACMVCGFDFSRTYGQVGAGFIEVHHKVPLATMGTDYRVNPAEDLVPVCPNCHAMLHRQSPPLTVAALGAIWTAQSENVTGQRGDTREASARSANQISDDD